MAQVAEIVPAGELETQLAVSGMTCANCARHVAEALRDVQGVERASVDLDSGTAQVRWKSDGTRNVEPLIAALQEAGYNATLATDSAPSQGGWSPIAGWRFNVVLGTAVTLPLLIAEWVFGFGVEPAYRWLSFILVLPLQLLGGARFYRGAWLQLKVGQSNMDTLVALGSTTAFLYSVWGLLSDLPGHLYFMDAAAILTLVSAGHFMEAKMSARAASALKGLLQLVPNTARRIGGSGAEESVAVGDLRMGDTVAVFAGERIPTDGQVIQGQTSADESMLTGESMPVEKGPGSKVFAGTMNENGRIQYRVTAALGHTALDHIIQIVQQAQSSRANIQRLGDRVSSVFVPIVVLIALAAALLWLLAPDSAVALQQSLARWLWPVHFAGSNVSAAVYHAAAILIVACPCAMGLATPIAIMAGTNAAARRGILIRNGEALEKSGKISAVLFDKTGTLTEGKVSVADTLEIVPGSLEIAAALAATSTHPLSKAIATVARSGVTFDEVTEVRGAGIQAHSKDGLFRLGSLQWLAKCGVFLRDTDAYAARWAADAATLTALARGDQIMAVFALKDSPKPGAREVVHGLNRSGYKVFLVTGDNRRTAEAVAAKVGIPSEHVRAELLPEGKVDFIRELQLAGEHVAFAGDGINDAPALKQAGLGIALMNASDVARESADIVLLKADLEAIPEALGLARATLRTIKQNLFWAFFYNALGIPLAFFGFLSPVFSAFAMGVSDLLVIGNALRLRYWRNG